MLCKQVTIPCNQNSMEQKYILFLLSVQSNLLCKLNPTIETTLNIMFHGCLQSVHYFQGLASIQSLSQTQNVASSLKDTSKAEILCYCFDSVLDYAHIVYPEHIFSPLKKYPVLYRLRIILEICYCFIKGRLNSCIRSD